MFVRLTQEDLDRALTEARRRDETHIETQMVSTLAELAFSKVTGLGVSVDYSEYGSQYTFPIQGFTIKVKGRETSLRAKPDLLIPPYQAQADIYVLAEFNKSVMQVVHLVGWCLNSTLIQEKIELPHGERYLVNRKDLNAINPLIERICKFTQ